MHKKLQLELIDKCLDTALSSLQGQDSIAETQDKTETQTPQDQDKAKTMTPKTKAKAP